MGGSVSAVSDAGGRWLLGTSDGGSVQVSQTPDSDTPHQWPPSTWQGVVLGPRWGSMPYDEFLVLMRPR